jgi:hypothetical protein
MGGVLVAGGGAGGCVVVVGSATEGACAALDSARYNKDDKHCPVRINQVHVLEKLFIAHVAREQYAVDLLAVLERPGD